MSEKDPSAPKISRRKALTLGLGVVGATVGAAYLGNPSNNVDNPQSQPLVTPSEQPVPTPTIELPKATATPDPKETERNNLETAGLKEFVPIYSLLEDYKRTYGVTPRLMWARIPNYKDVDLHTFLNDVAKKGATSENSKELQLFREGWGAKKDEMPQKLDKKFEEVEITDAGGGKEPDKVKAFLKEAANSFPQLVLALPKKLRVIPGGAGGVVADSLEIPKPDNYEAAIACLLSKGQEIADNNWSELKGFLSKEDYLNYLYTKTEQTKKIADSFFSKDWEAAQNFFDGSNMAPVNPGNVPELETKYSALLINSKVPDDKVGNLDYRYARVVHALGRKFYQIRSQNKPIEALSDQDKGFYLDQDTRHWVNGCNLKIFGGLGEFTKDKQDRLAKRNPETLSPEVAASKSAVLAAETVAFGTRPVSTPLELRASVGLIYDRESVFSKEEVDRHKKNIEQILGPKYAQMYEVAEEMQQKYRYTSANFLMPYQTSRGEVNLFEMLRAVGQFGKIPQTEEVIRELKEGWGEKSEQRDQAVEDRVNSFIIKDKLGRDPENMRTFLRNFGQVFPYYILALTDHINTGGGFGSSGEAGLEYPTNPEGAAVVLLHEGMHQIHGRWKHIKPYINEDTYLSFILKDLEIVKSTADAYFSAPWNEARSFKVNSPLINIDGKDTQNITDIEKGFPDYSLDGMSDADKKSNSHRRNRLMHYVGRTFSNMFENNKSIASLTENERKLVENSQTKEWMQATLGEIEHYFVGPIQRSDALHGNLPVKREELPNPDSLMVKNNEELQRARLEAFSVLPPDTSYADLRKALKLPV